MKVTLLTLFVLVCVCHRATVYHCASPNLCIVTRQHPVPAKLGRGRENLPSACPSLEIVLHVFSGRPDPVWHISSTNPVFDEIENKANISTALAPRLGYSGYTLVFTCDHPPKRTVTVGRCKDKGLENLLLNTVKDLIPDGKSEPLSPAVIQYVKDDHAYC